MEMTCSYAGLVAAPRCACGALHEQRQGGEDWGIERRRWSKPQIGSAGDAIARDAERMSAAAQGGFVLERFGRVDGTLQSQGEEEKIAFGSAVELVRHGI